MVNIVPARPPECNSSSPTNDWMYAAREHLSECLLDFPPPHGLRREFSYFTKPIKYKDTETLQLFFGNWTIHWQMSLHGDEEYDEQERYGDLTERILLSLDVETGGRKVPRIGKMQRFVLSRIADIVEEKLPEAEANLIEHHLVWEAVDFNPYDEDSVCVAAKRLAEFVTVLAEPAIKAVLEWSASEGLNMQSMRPLVLKAS